MSGFIVFRLARNTVRCIPGFFVLKTVALHHTIRLFNHYIGSIKTGVIKIFIFRENLTTTYVEILAFLQTA